MSTRSLIFTTILAGAAGISSTGCDSRCGEGTIDRDGVCVAADSAPDEANCGTNTVLGPDGKCTSEYEPTICDPDTTVTDETTIPGVDLCVGTGVASCNTFLPCPSADAGRVTVCGRLIDAETNEFITAATPNIAGCGEGGAEDGPCSLSVLFFDAVAFAGDPDPKNQTPPQNFYLDDCGRYTAQNIDSPDFGYIGVGVDDSPASGNNDYVLTGVAEEAGSADVVPRLLTYVAPSAAIADWSDDVGETNLATQGVFMSIFLHGTTPVAGVKVVDLARGDTTSGDDFYFDDLEPFSRTDASTAGPNSDNRTGPNGVALLLNSALTDHTGEGNEPDGCEWPVAPAVSIPSAVFVSLREAHVEGDAETPCPP